MWVRERFAKLALATIGVALVASACTRSVPAPVVYGSSSGFEKPDAERGVNVGNVGNADALIGWAKTQASRLTAAEAPTRPAKSSMPAVTRPAVQAQALPATPPSTSSRATERRAVAVQPTATRAPTVQSHVAPRTEVRVNRTADRIAGTSYVVTRGDTMFSIARRSGVPLNDLALSNRISPPYGLKVGQKLIIPKNRYHTVRRGETLYAIAHTYHVSAVEMARQNRLGASHRVVVGQSLKLPKGAIDPVGGGATKPPSPVLVASASQRNGGVVPTPGAKPGVINAAVAAPKHIPKPPRRASSKFAWPVHGRVISHYGPKAGGLHNDGINIAVPIGTPIRAADNGVVTYAGNELRGFGNLVLVRHTGGWVTAYAHASRIDVRVGQTVKRGQVLGRAGTSGHVSTPQLHFEIRRGRGAVDPMRFLSPPSQQRVAINRSAPRGGRPDPG